MRHLRIMAAAVFGVLVAGSSASTGQTFVDITHHEIQDTIRYSATGGAPINGKYGYAWGSYTCNIGNASLSWVSGGTPALAMNAYRLHDGRLLQIGLGNAKHSCCVGNGAGCGTTCSTSGFGLRPGCRDVYNASFNGGQSRLGPRSGINPYDSTFSAIPAGSGDAIWRRVQISVADMDSVAFAGAQYFAEGVYVCLEEEPAQQLNNATYRPMLVANTGAAPTYNWSITGASVSGQPAIVAWRDHGLGLNQPDNSVKVVTADVPGEGRFFAAGKVRDLSGTGAGPWRYDYAVFNLNSHRSGGSFEVDISPSAVVSNVGFHAPDYHSGEIYSNADWTGSGTSKTMLRWASPADFATDPNTNALRWGTMYNFWFTANLPPAAGLGSVRLGLFRPGTPDSITISGLPVPPCPGDFNGVNGTSVQDIFDFVAAYFGGIPTADVNGVNGITVDDIFDFLADYFTTCP